MDNPTEPVPTAAPRMPSEAEMIGCKSVRVLFLLAEQSSLTPRDFWKAVVRVANNEAALSAALKNGEWDRGKDDPKKAQKPIEIPE